jgi:hypothetical protein
MDASPQFNNQEDALYDSEWDATKSDKALGRKMGPWRAQRLLRKVTGNSEARVKIDRRLGEHDIYALAQTKPEEWYGNPGDVFFNPPKGRVLPTRRVPVSQVLHEASHQISPEEGHSEKFAKTYVDSVQENLGENAAKTLKTKFDSKGVKY